MTPGDGEAAGDGFFRDMSAQSARAHDFESRLRWSRLSKRLRSDDEVEGHGANGVDDVSDVAPVGEAEPAVIDLRGDEAATSSAAPEVPRQRR